MTLLAILTVVRIPVVMNPGGTFCFRDTRFLDGDGLLNGAIQIQCFIVVLSFFQLDRADGAGMARFGPLIVDGVGETGRIIIGTNFFNGREHRDNHGRRDHRGF